MIILNFQNEVKVVKDKRNTKEAFGFYFLCISILD